MFTADLSWSEHGIETVGERRERKARERASTANSVRTTTSARSSATTDRELWWTSGLKKAKSIKPMRRPPSHRSTGSQNEVKFTPKKPGDNSPVQQKDPTLQPSWIYASTLSPTLPSGASFELPVHEVPDLDTDTSSRRTDSTEPRLSYERRWEVRSPLTFDILEESHEETPRSPLSLAADRASASSATTQKDVSVPILKLEQPKLKERPALAPVAVLSYEALKLHEAMQEAKVASEAKSTSFDRTRHPRATECLPLSQWECLTPREVPLGMHVAPKPGHNKVAMAHSSTMRLTRFQRFIRRMENAGPKIVLDRLQEDWEEPLDEERDEEFALEKQLWLLTGFQLQILSKNRMVPKPDCDTQRILELYGNLSEVFQASAMYPDQNVHFLTTKPKRPITLPENVSYLTVRDFGVVPLPYPESYFSHIRASKLPSVVPSSNLPELFKECYKLLAPGGLLEVRIMNAAPMRSTQGPLLRMWIEDRLSVNLERQFRCSKPCTLVPGWLTDAGFDLKETEVDSRIALPCAFDSKKSDIDIELSTTIGRSLWKDVWGSFVDDNARGPKWWWDDEEIVRECLEYKTTFECRAIVAYKEQ